ncbi:36950_t:CDS:2, partial [Racocetra persica]
KTTSPIDSIIQQTIEAPPDYPTLFDNLSIKNKYLIEQIKNDLEHKIENRVQLNSPYQ